ncbi:hypothetical protein [Acinetobacter baumannii]|uniref:hypothetical protein n=1 Tax=Acinetobacter baumannii TaxID=470 RepID=UPI003F4BD1DF
MLKVLKLDSFRLNVSFDFEAHPDSYGVPGSEFTAVDITQLTQSLVNHLFAFDINVRD